MSKRTGALKIISPDGIFYDGRMLSVIMPTSDGQLEFLPYHEEMVAAIITGELKYKTEDEKWHIAAVGGGVAQTANNRCLVYVDFAEKPEDIDKNRAKAALDRAKEQMRQKKSLEEYKLSQASMARALTRLRVADKEPF